jgi:hypothetical protein
MDLREKQLDWGRDQRYGPGRIFTDWYRIPQNSYRNIGPRYQNGKVRLRGSPDHVGHEALVAGSVQYREVLLLRLEVGSTHLHRLAFVALCNRDARFLSVQDTKTGKIITNDKNIYTK